MAIGAPLPAKAIDPIAAAQQRIGSAGGRGQRSAAGAVIARTGLLRRHWPRDLWALAAALAGPPGASAVLLPFRASWSNTNAALLLVVVVVVVAVAAAGNMLAGALAAVGAAVWFAFFTLPYYRLTVRSRDDVTTVGRHGAWEVEQAGLPAELELRVFGNGQYHGRFLMRPRSAARPTLQARTVAIALAEQVGHAYSAARVSGSAC